MSLSCGPWARHIYPSLVLVEPRTTRSCLTERLLMGRKESNQTNKSNKTVSEDFAYIELLHLIGSSNFKLNWRKRPLLSMHLGTSFRQRGTITTCIIMWFVYSKQDGQDTSFFRQDTSKTTFMVISPLVDLTKYCEEFLCSSCICKDK